MIKNLNVLPAPVVSAIVARFDPDLDTLRFGSNITNITLDNNATYYSDGSWVVSATHVSGLDLVVRVSKNLKVTFDVWCNRCRSAPCECGEGI